MKEININIEGYNVNGICVGCLNYNRKMFYDDDVKECFKTIANIDVPDGLTIQVCWECLAAVRKVTRFQTQILSAYNVLIDYSKKHTFLNSPKDLTVYASTGLSTSTVQTDCLNVYEKELGSNSVVTQEDEAAQVKVETKDEPALQLESDDGNEGAEYPGSWVVDPDPGSSDEDQRLSALQHQNQAVKKETKKKKHKSKTSESAGRKLRNLPNIVELHSMSEEEMWRVRAADVDSDTFRRLRHKCERCVMTFNTRRLKETHEAGKHTQKAQRAQLCDVCNSYFHTKDNMDAHRSLHLAAFRCRLCGLVTTLKTRMREHGCSLEHSSAEYPCTYCDKVFSSKPRLAYHRSKACSAERPQCDCCGKVFANKMTLKYHLKFYQMFGVPGVLGCIDGTHVAIIRPKEDKERYYVRKGIHSLNVMIICDANLNIICVDASIAGSAHDSIVWQSHPLSSHLTELTNNGEQVYLLGDSGYPLRRTMMTPILNTVDGTAQHHYYTKHETARNTIDRCIAVLKARYRLLPVKKENKPKENLSIPCKGCDKVFTSKKAYRAHVVIHEGNKYPCPICGKLFMWKRNLSRHTRAHTDRAAGATPQCRECNKTFASRDCYNNHMRLSKRHAMDSVYIHECNYCGKKFPTKWCLVDHVDWEHLKRIKYQCSVCFKAFKTAKVMQSHVNNIHGVGKREPDGQHLCEKCGKSYKSVKRLKGHVWAMHTQRSLAKTYKCTLCAVTFTWPSSIYKHMKIMHSNKRNNKVTRAPSVKKQDPYSDLQNFMHTLQPLQPQHAPQNIV